MKKFPVSELARMPKPMRYETMPDCDYRALQHVRIYRVTNDDGTVTDTLEMLYEDGYGKAFWGPVPIVEAKKSPQREG